MVRTVIGVVCVGLFGIVGCNKTPEDPGLTATASATSPATDGSGSESPVEDEDETIDTQGVTSSTGGPEETSEPPASSSGPEMTTAPETTGEEGCGDGMVVPGEQCDGADLQGFDCASLGLGGGTLACDPVTCSFDTSMCMSTSSGTSG
jgi:hypothetical protein